MSVGVVNKTTGDRIQTAGDPLDKVGNLANLTTTAKTNAVEAINEVNTTKANQTQLATVEASTTASKAYSANEYLVLDGVLYKVTANIAQGGTIVTEGAGKNVDLATVGGELSAINSNISNIPICVGVTKKITLASEASGSVNVSLSDFTVPSGYMFQPATLVVCVYGNWGVTASAVACAYTDGDDVLTANNSLRIDITSNPSGGNVNFRVNIVAYCSKVTS